MNLGRLQPRAERSFLSLVSRILAMLVCCVCAPSFGADAEEGLVTVLKTDANKDIDSALPGEVANAVDEDLINEIKDGMTNAKYAKCRESLPKRLQNYETALADLKTYAATKPAPTVGNLRKREIKLDALRKEYLVRVSQCGPCRARIVTSWKGKGSDFWYATDGSCFVDFSDTAAMGKGFEAATKSLRTRSEYVQFPHIVKVETLTANKKDFDTGAALLSDDFAALLAIRTPLELFGKLQTFFYHIENKITEGTDANSTRNFALNFSSFRRFKEKTQAGKEMNKIEPLQVDSALVRRFEGWTKAADGSEKFETAFWISPGGRKVGLSLNQLKSVYGLWFITESGTLRYFTTGDFSLPSSYIEDQANDVLLEALLDMHRRFKTAEEPKP